MDPVAQQEALEIAKYLLAALPPQVEGRTAIVEMRDGGSRHWKQMEWIGFYVEYIVEARVRREVGAKQGPMRQNTRFDLQLTRVWDLKAHPVSVPTSPLNDQVAIRECIRDYGGVGFVILEVDAEYDESGEFKKWHDELKGDRSRYEDERVARGAPSRRRKVAFRPMLVTAIYLSSESDIQDGLAEGWLSEFQTGMRNSDGTPRRAKFAISPNRVPSKYIAVQVRY